jgi:hypothetical protein
VQILGGADRDGHLGTLTLLVPVSR